MAPIFCADCGTECDLIDGRSVDIHNPEIADAWVWACPVCPASWAHQDKDGGCVGLPAGQATVNARALLRLQVVIPLVRQAPPNEQMLAAGGHPLKGCKGCGGLSLVVVLPVSVSNHIRCRAVDNLVSRVAP